MKTYDFNLSGSRIYDNDLDLTICVLDTEPRPRWTGTLNSSCSRCSSSGA